MAIRTYKDVEFGSQDELELYQSVLEIMEGHEHCCLDDARERQQVALAITSELRTLLEVED